MSTPNRKTALITGATGGIGRSLVKVFHDAGYDVVATDITPRPDALPCSYYIQADLALLAEDAAYTSAVIDDFKRALDGRGLHALINNAAIQILGGVDSLTREDWRSTLNLNLLSPFLLTQQLIPTLEAANGCIINIGSIHARLTKRNFVAYATSKAALAGMTRALAVDLGPRVRVNAIEPAAIETEMLKAGFRNKPNLSHQLEACHPQQRIGRADEVARLALVLADGGIGFLHGACIGLDGGIGARLFDPT